jgi:acyl-CoA reductase-like NAD-dependent aldehyde dehydrogenase
MAYRMLIDGRLVGGTVDADVINPATRQPFESAPRADATLAGKAVAAAAAAFAPWSRLGYEKRRPYLERFAEALKERNSELSRLLTLEQGKPLRQAEREIQTTIDVVRYFASAVLEDRVLRDNALETIVAQRYPQGVVAAITPWNFPVVLLAYKLAPALITGNTVIAKPAPTTPLTTLLLGEIAAEIFPAGVFQTLADRNDIGPLLTEHPDVAHVSFTGSTPTGRQVMRSAAGTLKRFTLELGGNDVSLVLDDADLDEVAPAVFDAAMTNAGQLCFATKRVYAPRALYDGLVDRLSALADAAIVGDGLEQGTTVGPIQNEAQYNKVMSILDDTRTTGSITAGGRLGDGEGYFIRPTIVRDIEDQARLVREEQFGPVLPILSYEDIHEVLARVNDSEYGLGGAVWTSDVDRGISVAGRIESGTVWVNRHRVLPFDVPFGGAKQSGIGLQNGIEGMEDFTQLRIVNAGRA